MSPRTLVALHRAGEFDRAELLQRLRSLTYTRGTYPPGTYDAYIPGTLDELTLLAVQRELSNEEFEQIITSLKVEA